MTPLWWSVMLAAIGILGIWLAGRKSPIGWGIGLGAQFLWIAFAIHTEQYGFILSAVAYGGIYLYNWTKWQEDELRAAERSCPETASSGKACICSCHSSSSTGSQECSRDL